MGLVFGLMVCGGGEGGGGSAGVRQSVQKAKLITNTKVTVKSRCATVQLKVKMVQKKVCDDIRV